jgi:hypothetical protein
LGDRPVDVLLDRLAWRAALLHDDRRGGRPSLRIGPGKRLGPYLSGAPSSPAGHAEETRSPDVERIHNPRRLEHLVRRDGGSGLETGQAHRDRRRFRLD